MRLIFFACSKKACDKMQETKERWLAENPEDEIICVVKCKALGELSEKKSLSECTGEWFQRADGLVYFCAVGIAVRSIAPYLVHKSKDPAVVVFDETCRYGISLLSGHLGGANELTERLCSLNGAEPVITTASDREGKIAIDVFAAENGLYITDYSAAKDLEAALLAGEKIGFLEEGAEISLKGKLTEEFVCGEEASACRAGVLVSPFRYEKKPFPLTLQLVPKCVTVGIGCKRGMTKEQIKQAVQSRAAEAGIFSKAICQAASIDLKKEEPGILGFCEEERLPFLTFSAQTLQEQKGEFTPSAFVCRVTGVDNVCERSAVAASGGKVLAAKRAYEGVTVAFAGQTERNVQTQTRDALEKCAEMGINMKKLYVVGIGPGVEEGMTAEARHVLQEVDLIVGYTVYVNLVKKVFPEKEYFETGMRGEVERCRAALEKAQSGIVTAVVCSGDAEVYGMAGLVLELSEKEFVGVEIQVVAGVTAALSGGAVLGAPLGHDFAVISLSDLLTPWETIEKRLRAARAADFCICLYNPSSKKRGDYLQRACDIMLENGGTGIVCGYVTNIGREGQSYCLTTLEKLREAKVDMFTTVFIGNSQTRVIRDKMVTSRGYRGV